ncbi:NAD(P)H-hydrate epimerase [Microbacterium sp. NPDC091313]
MTDSPLTGAYLAAAVRAAERPLLEAGEPLMREAAAALADIALERLRGASGGAVLVLAGAGDNGGDALFAAATIAGAGHDVDVVLTADRSHRQALAAALAAGARLRGTGEVCTRPGSYALVLDGILGIGAAADARLRGAARAIVEALLPLVASGVDVIAVDIPSGLHPDDGAADDVVLPASVTVTFGAVKAGLVRGRGPELAGEVRLVDLGLGPALARARPAVTGPVPVVRVPRPQRA